MQFRFTRDEEGTERIHVGDVCVGKWINDGHGPVLQMMSDVEGVTNDSLMKALGRADEAGFWDHSGCIVEAREQINRGDYTPEEIFGVGGWSNVRNEVTVDVPVPETTATLTLVSDGEDQS